MARGFDLSEQVRASGPEGTRRQPAVVSERPRGEGVTPEYVFPMLDQLATPAGLPRLIDLAMGGRADTALRTCRGPTWTNVAQRALHLAFAVVSDHGLDTPPELLRRICDMRAVGVNWVYAEDDSPAGHSLFNIGTFDFDTTELRRAALRCLDPAKPPPPQEAVADDRPSARVRIAQSIAARMRGMAPAQPLPETGDEGEPLDDIMEEQHEAVRQNPTEAAPYRALQKLFVHREEFDRAWCACQALALLGKADKDERRFYEEHRPLGLLSIKSRLDTVLWEKNLYHHDQDLDITRVFEVLAPAALKAKIHLLRASNQLSVMDARFKQDPKGSTVTLVKTFGWAAEVFGIRCPELYVRSDLPGALVAVPMRPPASLAGSTVCSGLQPQELAFIVGKHMSYYRSDHYVKCLFPDVAELYALFCGALELVGVDAPSSNVDVAHFRDLLAKCVEQDRIGMLRQAVHRWVKGRGGSDISRWARAVELTASRAGLVLSGDLGAACAMINAEPKTFGELPVEDKLADLFAFSVSAEYFALRAMLGIAIA
jgi:hypothetical protein